MALSRLHTPLRLPAEKDMIFFLIRLYAVGLLGFILPVLKPCFITLIPLFLIVGLTLVMLYELNVNRKRGTGYFITFVVLVYFLSFGIEAAGVNTGVIFGQYRYDNGLGIQLFHTPLIIGVNWILLVLGSAYISQFVSDFMGFSETRIVDGLFRIIIAAFLMVSVDFVLERVAPWMEMWSWLTPRIPGRNYLSWLLISLVFHSYYVIGRIQQRTRIASAIFIIQFFFFLLLFFYLRFFYSLV